MVETVRCRHMLSNRMSCRHSDLDWGHFMLCKNHLAHKKKERKKATSGNKSWFMFPQRASYEKFTCCLILSSYMCECVMLCNVVWCCVMLCNVGSSPLSQISSLRLPRGYQGKCSRSLSYSKSSCGRSALSTMTLTSPLRPLSTLHSPLWSGPPPPPPTSSTSTELTHTLNTLKIICSSCSPPVSVHFVSTFPGFQVETKLFLYLIQTTQLKTSSFIVCLV